MLENRKIGDAIGKHGSSYDHGNTVVIDVDGVLVDFYSCGQGCDYSNYPANRADLPRDKCPLVKGALEAMTAIKDAGFNIILFTARREDERRVTEAWLDSHGIPYDRLIMGKPQGFIYIDDFACAFSSWDATMADIIVRLRHLKKGDKAMRIIDSYNP